MDLRLIGQFSKAAGSPAGAAGARPFVARNLFRFVADQGLEADPDLEVDPDWVAVPVPA
jgi:hypothetical protein